MRALLIVPEGDVAAFAQALASGADAVLADAAAAADWRGQGPALYLRVRGFEEPGALDDMAAGARLRPAGVALACAGGADVLRLGARLAVEEARLGLGDGALRILAFAIETPAAVMGLSSYRDASTRLAGLVVTRTALAQALRAASDSGPVRLARDLAVVAARAAGVLAIEASEAAGVDVRAATGSTAWPRERPRRLRSFRRRSRGNGVEKRLGRDVGGEQVLVAPPRRRAHDAP